MQQTVLHLIRRLYLPKSEIEGIDAFHLQNGSEDNPYDKSSNSFQHHCWGRGWHKAFMWHAAKHNLLEFQEWENVTKAGFGDSDTLLFLFMLCPRRFRYGWEKAFGTVAVVVIALGTIGILFYDEDRGFISSIEGIGLWLLFGVCIMAIIAVPMFGWKFVRTKPLHFVGLIVLVWLGLLVTDTKVLVWSDSVWWFESICGNDCTILKYDYHGKPYNIEVSDEVLNLPSNEQEAQFKSRLDRISFMDGSMKNTRGNIDLGEHQGYLRCTYFNGRQLIKQDYSNYYGSCPILL
jgi:hypothetical protein